MWGVAAVENINSTNNIGEALGVERNRKARILVCSETYWMSSGCHILMFNWSFFSAEIFHWRYFVCFCSFARLHFRKFCIIWNRCREEASQYRHHQNFLPTSIRGGRYYRKKLSTADISEFFKLSANYRYRILGIWELSKNYRYRKLHPILSDKHNWKHCSKNKKGTTMINRKAACCQRLLVQQSQHRQCDGARYKICCEKHNSWTCQTKICGGFAIHENIVE